MLGYLITGVAGIFWIFRIAVALLYTNQEAFPIIPLNMTVEIVVLFITFACIILMAKRKMLGAVIYLITQCAYFGVDGYKSLQTIVEGTPTSSTYISLMIAVIAVIIPILSIMDIGLKTGKKSGDKKTEWFYGNPDYERKFDDRADKNQYKF